MNSFSDRIGSPGKQSASAGMRLAEFGVPGIMAVVILCSSCMREVSRCIQALNLK